MSFNRVGNIILLLTFLVVLKSAAADFPDSLKQAIKSKSPKEQVDYLNKFAEDHYQKNEALAKLVLTKSLALAENAKYQKGQAIALKAVGLLAYYKGDYAEALEKFQAAINLLDEKTDPDGKGAILNELGNLLRKHDDTKHAEEYLRKALQLYTVTGNKDGLANSNNNLGVVFETNGQLDSAMVHYQTALDLYTALNDTKGMSYSLDYIGLIHAYREEYVESEKYLLKALAIREQSGERIAYATSLENLGELKLAMEDFDAAENYFRRSIRVADSLHFADLSSYNNKMLAEVNYRKKNYKDAYEYYKTFSTLNDSLFNDSRTRQIAEMQAKYETAEKEEENSKLAQENQLKELNITRKNNQLILLSGVLLAGLLGGLLYNNRQKLLQQKRLLEEKQNQQVLRLKAVIESQESERQRIAAELHDGLGQTLAAARMRVSTENGTKESLQLIDKSCEELREISHNMMPSNLVRNGLKSALEELVSRINTGKNLTINLEVELTEPRLPIETEIHIYRIIQELLTNIIKYAEATEVSIQVIKDEHVSITVEDNGKGFDKKILETASGNGWYNIYSRVAVLKGTVEVDAGIGRGVVVTIEIEA